MEHEKDNVFRHLQENSIVCNMSHGCPRVCSFLIPRVSRGMSAPERDKEWSGIFIESTENEMKVNMSHTQ